MPAEWWFEARTEEEAIERGIEELGLTRDEVEVVEVTQTEKGLLGLIGRKVRVLLRVKQDWRTAWTKPSEAEKPSEDESEADEQPPLIDDEGGPPLVDEEEGEIPTGSAEAGEPDAAEAPPSAEVLEAQAKATEFLKTLLEKMGLAAEVAGHSDAEGVHLEARGENGGILIGRRGATLDAIQYMVNRVISRGRSEASRVFVDAEGYRARRNQQVKEMALRLADRAKKTGKPVTLKNLSARERRIVHQALQKDRALSTKSVGEGEERKLLIIPRRSSGRQHGA